MSARRNACILWVLVLAACGGQDLTLGSDGLSDASIGDDGQGSGGDGDGDNSAQTGSGGVGPGDGDGDSQSAGDGDGDGGDGDGDGDGDSHMDSDDPPVDCSTFGAQCVGQEDDVVCDGEKCVECLASDTCFASDLSEPHCVSNECVECRGAGDCGGVACRPDGSCDD